MLETKMKIEVFADDESAARAAAGMIALDAREAVKTRGRFVMAVSGGRTPWITRGARGGPGQKSDAPSREFARPFSDAR
jgi:hypothetical protein